MISSQIKRSKNTNIVNGIRFKSAFYCGIKELSLNQELVNSINVLPVPNGDTGDNIQKTLMAALSEMSSGRHIGKQAAQCARGALVGARGSAGIIFTNFLLGFADSLQNKENASTEDIIEAVNRGCLRAVDAMPEPLPGSLYDTCELMRQRLSLIAPGECLTLTDITTLIHDTALNASNEASKNNTLLSKIGIKDAGAIGAYFFIKGICGYATNGPLEKDRTEEPRFDIPEDALIKESVLYNVEFLINNMTLSAQELKRSLSDIGSLVFIAHEEGGGAKVLIRTEEPKKVFDRSARFGKSTMIRVNDLIDEQKYFLSKIRHKETI